MDTAIQATAWVYGFRGRLITVVSKAAAAQGAVAVVDGTDERGGRVVSGYHRRSPLVGQEEAHHA